MSCEGSSSIRDNAWDSTGAAGGPQGRTPRCRAVNTGDLRTNRPMCWWSDPRRETLSLSHGMALVERQSHELSHVPTELAVDEPRF